MCIRDRTQDVELTADDLKELANQFKAEYKEKIGSDFPTDPKEQLMEAIKAVFRSWDNPRANVYRRDNDIPYSDVYKRQAEYIQKEIPFAGYLLYFCSKYYIWWFAVCAPTI